MKEDVPEMVLALLVNIEAKVCPRPKKKPEQVLAYVPPELKTRKRAS